jgi:hypothetical protein
MSRLAVVLLPLDLIAAPLAAEAPPAAAGWSGLSRIAGGRFGELHDPWRGLARSAAGTPHSAWVMVAETWEGP